MTEVLKQKAHYFATFFVFIQALNFFGVGGELESDRTLVFAASLLNLRGISVLPCFLI